MHKINKLLPFILLFLSGTIQSQNSSFLTAQLKFPRVKTAWKNSEKSILAILKKEEIDKNQVHIFIRAFKSEGILEVWAKNKNQTSYHLLKTYDICASSGNSGPKLVQGDGQVPEGVYTIDRFNPSSSYHLSLGISYPNAVDLKRSGSQNPGGDIFIHGKCVTIGCMPLTDPFIEEVYMLAVLAKNAGQTIIPVHIFPFRLEKSTEKWEAKFPEAKKWGSFWKNLQEIYLYFEKYKQPGTWKKGSKGDYVLN